MPTPSRLARARGVMTASAMIVGGLTASACAFLGPERRDTPSASAEHSLVAQQFGGERLQRTWGDSTPCGEIVGLAYDAATLRVDSGLVIRIGADSASLTTSTGERGDFRANIPGTGGVWIELPGNTRRDARLVLGANAVNRETGNRMLILTQSVPDQPSVRAVRVAYTYAGYGTCPKDRAAHAH